MNSLKINRITVPIILLFITIGTVTPQIVTPWFTSGDKSRLLEQQPTVNFVPKSAATSVIVTVDQATTYQTMDGFGYCMTEGSAEVISSLNASQQAVLLNELFNPSTGLGISVLRISIGASDLSSTNYSYDDTPADEALANFSLTGPDLTYLIPILQKVLAINPTLKIVATPWSPPRWMKTNNAWVGGSLNTFYYAAYAAYFVKYIDAMKALGISIWAITPQNEPENPNNNPSMSMTSSEETNFINNNLGPALANGGHSNVRIIAYDHNCDDTAYPIYVCNNSSYVDGAAFHLYAGNISALSTVKNATNKNIYFTEQYTGSTGSFSGDLGWHLQNVIIGASNNWSKTSIEWNLATDPAFGPHTSGGCSTCQGAITINSSTSYSRNVAYYIIGQISKFVPSGAVRIYGSSSNSNFYASAFKNPDGTIAVVTYNNLNSSQIVKMVWNAQSFLYSVPALSAATFIWSTAPNALPEIQSSRISISPNPGHSFVTLKLQDHELNFTSISFITPEGKTAMSQSILTESEENTINVSGLAPGIYLIKVSGPKESIYVRFIKQ